MIPFYVVIHHSLTADGKAKDWDSIRRFHRSWRYDGRIVSPEEAVALRSDGKIVIPPWSDIGYHHGIERVDGTLRAFPGRPDTKAGAHCKEAGMNSRSVGVCVVGNFDEEPPDIETLHFLKEMVWAIMLAWSIPVHRVIGHREAGMMDGYDWRKGQYKTCPGRVFPMMGLRGMLAG